MSESRIKPPGSGLRRLSIALRKLATGSKRAGFSVLAGAATAAALLIIPSAIIVAAGSVAAEAYGSAGLLAATVGGASLSTIPKIIRHVRGSRSKPGWAAAGFLASAALFGAQIMAAPSSELPQPAGKTLSENSRPEKAVSVREAYETTPFNLKDYFVVRAARSAVKTEKAAVPHDVSSRQSLSLHL